jgi:hypothetical protein
MIYAWRHVVELGAKLVIWISLILEDLAGYYLGFGKLQRNFKSTSMFIK